MSKVEADILTAMREQQGFIAVEKLGGNIVKEEFHKGALFGLRVAMGIIEESTPEAIEPAAQSGEAPVQQLKAAIALVRSFAHVNLKTDAIGHDFYWCLESLEQRAAV